ncbi:MAG: hypothetical protein P1P65_07265 [Treponema sp.]
MQQSIFNNDDYLLPEPVKKAAIEYLPNFLTTNDPETLSSHALLIARAFHTGCPFEQVFIGNAAETQSNQISLIKSFEKNVRLLVEKTWVEQSGEELKDDILYRLQYFCKSMIPTDDTINYAGLLPECLGVLRDVVLLLFGRQIDTGNFLDYAIRIDPDFGLFWYYIECLMGQPQMSVEKARLAIFLGMYFLANF